MVVGDRGELRGLLCLNHAGTGFCNRTARCAGEAAPERVRTSWRVRRTDDSTETQDGLLVAPQGKGFAIGDTLNLPPPAQCTRWVVVEVGDDPLRPGGGIVTVDPFDP